MDSCIRIGDRLVGDGHPCFMVAEIGINHNGDLGVARQLIDCAALAGCDAVKFQKRTPELCVPPKQRNVPRETPWGVITYMAYRRRVEFGQEEYDQIDQYCRLKGMMWTASCWDLPSLEFMRQFDPPFHKVPSAMLTNDDLLEAYRRIGKPVLVSTGMSTEGQIRHAAEVLGDRLPWMFLHCVSTYPSSHDEVNLRTMDWLRREFGRPVGYSGHERGLQISLAAAALGASVIERHVTLDRTMWGSDQAASLEIEGLRRLVRDVRVLEQAMGDGVKRLWDSEVPILRKLRHGVAADLAHRGSAT
jgi:N-acetylneuraminate synthase